VVSTTSDVWVHGLLKFVLSIKNENPPSKYGLRKSRLSMGYIIKHGLYRIIQVEYGLYCVI
jgi:hypothetical protein